MYHFWPVDKPTLALRSQLSGASGSGTNPAKPRLVLIVEEYDQLEPGIAENLLGGSYQADLQDTVIGIKTQN
ncbi:hypothetical protein [Mycobacterium colombiense]|uniref:hypothetical protein n=1 Tax=Mycobacterium colombiense TaxID=339268 RepID=UPI0012DB399A|nr:hypothetical protein [Mycobacterium colombiense]